MTRTTLSIALNMAVLCTLPLAATASETLAGHAGANSSEYCIYKARAERLQMPAFDSRELAALQRETRQALRETDAHALASLKVELRNSVQKYSEQQVAQAFASETGARSTVAAVPAVDSSGLVELSYAQ